MKKNYGYEECYKHLTQHKLEHLVLTETSASGHGAITINFLQILCQLASLLHAELQVSPTSFNLKWNKLYNEKCQCEQHQNAA